jgi:ammonium transporter Rh
MEEITQIDFFATTVLISLGSLIGKLTLGQYFIVIFCETLFASLNYFICYFAIGGIDTGGSLYIFAFGALFGFIVSFVLAYDERFKKIISKSKNNKSSYYSNVFSAIGSLFLWLYFPSFNTARIHYDENKKYIMDIMRYRGIINTYMSMIGSLVASFCTSSLVITERKFKMEHILRGSYVGGVIIAGCCTFCAYPWAALLIGFFGGIVSVLLIHLATPKEEEAINPEENSNNNNINHCLYNFILAMRMSDTMGVIYCFGVPGILGGIFTLIFLGSFNHEPWKKKITLANGLERTAKREFNDFFYYKRTPSAQVGIQIGALFITIVIAICSGIITGFFMKVFDYSGEEVFFMDNMIMEEKNYVPEYSNKKILSSSENKLNNDDNEDGREVDINQENNNNDDYNIK